jgi:hypothetical protein
MLCVDADVVDVDDVVVVGCRRWLLLLGVVDGKEGTDVVDGRCGWMLLFGVVDGGCCSVSSMEDVVDGRCGWQGGDRCC